MVEPVHSREALAGRPATQQLHLALLGDLLAPLVGLHTLDSVLQQEVAVVGKDRTTGVVQLVGLGGWLENLAKTIQSNKLCVKKSNQSWNDLANDCILVRITSIAHLDSATPASCRPDESPPQPANTSKVDNLWVTGGKLNINLMCYAL